jgi:putative heme-binding domain-containing protein
MFGGVFARVAKAALSEQDVRAIADVALAVPSAEAGAFLLRQLERGKPDRETAGNWLRHAARYAPVEEMDKLAAFARKQLPEGFGEELYPELERQFALFKFVDEGLQQRGGTLPAAIRDWGAELVKRYFHSLDTHHVWGYQPYEASPTANPWDFEKRRCADGQTRTFTSSFPHGEQLTGVLRSPVFTLQDKLSFWLCGHDGVPDKPAKQKNHVRLRLADSGEVVAEVFAPRNDVAQRINWNLAAHQGKKAYLEAIDGDTGNAYAWIAFSGFEPNDGHLRPPEFAPRKETDWFVAATELAVKLQIKDYVALFERIAVPGAGADVSFVDPDMLAAGARAWIALAPEPAAIGMSKEVSDAKLPLFYRDRIGGLLAEMNSTVAHEAVIAAMKSSSGRMQDRWAQSLAGNPNGAEALLASVETGNLSARLLQPAAVRNRLKATKPKDWEERITRLTKDLPPANEAVEKLIAERRNAYTAANGNAAAGARVFEQNCAVCHRVDGKGGLIGPQLDGIGNRGLDRLLEDILDPNRNVDRAFRTHTVVLKDGDVISGLPRREEGELLILADSTGKENSVPKKEIQSRRESDTSLMPENFGEIISPENFSDLIAFLLSHGPAPTPKQ